MAYHITHRYGADERELPFSSFAAVLRELDDNPDDEEHVTVALTHESGWCLSVSSGGYVIWEHLESDNIGPRHMLGVATDEILRLWRLLAQGKIEEIDKAPWQPGYE